MMKTGMNLLLWTGFVTKEHFRLLAKLKKAGFDGVEVPIFNGDDSHYKIIRRELDNLGLRATTVALASLEENPISPDKSKRDKAVERLKRNIEWTAILGGDIMAGPFHSPLGVFSGTGPTGEEKKCAADVLHKAAEAAQKVNVTLALEYPNRFECYFLTTAADAKALVQRVNHPHLRMMYDTFHAHIEEKNISLTIGNCAECIVHIHISENDRGVPGSGQVHWEETFRALRKANYDRWLVIEAFGRALPELAAATKIWRDLFTTPEDLYTQGLRFMNEKWAAAEHA
jgi:D-psicose/D-tagatose/L-ribulose 3-epimerase